MRSLGTLLSVAEVFARLGANPASIPIGNKEVVKSCKVFVKVAETIFSRKRAGSWAVQNVLVPVQIFPVYICAFR